ncbi:hypothetical protein RND81_10G174700 [Saponaria officinalis]|uniref:Uncharacterized protein n=1 Tax=Saponaria officinalis TaxID=3572 RepID=A0AAW1I404_SAPOF
MSIMFDNPRTDQIVSDGFLKIKPLISGLNDERKNGLVLNSCSSSSSSSIGLNSDDDNDLGNNNHDFDDDGDDEVESKLKISPFDSAVDSLEQALPIRRGISNFYSGKSKSFASLADVACSSVKDITKTENAYSRKRKNLLAFSLYDKSRTPLPKYPGIAGKSTNACPTTSTRKVSTNDCESDIDENVPEVEVNARQNSRTPPLPPVASPWRSFSLADLQNCAVSVGALNSKVSNLRPALIGKRSKHDEVS